MASSILITQCMQMDFVKPIGKYEPLPNLLHVGYGEARRLVGEKPEEGPVARVMNWAYQRNPEEFRILHIRDWHDPNDPVQAEHLRQFGAHCLQDTEGAKFAFANPPALAPRVSIINSLSLNDFNATNLDEWLAPYATKPMRIGIMGVWTEAKVMFLAYELRTRYPNFQVAVCSALTASPSRSQHFVALDQMEKLLGVHVYPSIGKFLEFLGPGCSEAPIIETGNSAFPTLEVDTPARLTDHDRQLLRYLFRDSRSVKLNSLDGGFSGNLVLGSQSVDMFGHQQAPHVIKIGPQEPIGRERASFERVESVLGNNAPRIVDFADVGDRGGIKYRYASMDGAFAQTFQKLYSKGLSAQKVRDVLQAVFVEQLGKFYAAANIEKADLLDYYCFSSKWAPSVRQQVEKLMGEAAREKTLQFRNGCEFPNLCHFYENELDRLPKNRADTAWFAYVHGDLNGANVVVDRHENVWLIDFFHTHRGHVLRDLIKLENDILYIYTPVRNEEEFWHALAFTRKLMEVGDLAAPLPPWSATGLLGTEFERAYEAISYMRSLYPALIQSDRDPLQLLIAQMRYAVHTLSFDESNDWQKKWALYTASLCGEQIIERLERVGPLRVDWLESKMTTPGRLGLTILPGRKDSNRDVVQDLGALKKAGVTHVGMLLTHDELRDYGVANLRQAYNDAGITHRHLSIVDQRICSKEEMREFVKWLEEAVGQGGSVVLHCVGGIGRSGSAAACFLKRRGVAPADAITEVRRVRSPRAIETKLQEDFVMQF